MKNLSKCFSNYQACIFTRAMIDVCQTIDKNNLNSYQETWSLEWRTKNKMVLAFFNLAADC